MFWKRDIKGYTLKSRKSRFELILIENELPQFDTSEIRQFLHPYTKTLTTSEILIQITNGNLFWKEDFKGYNLDTKIDQKYGVHMENDLDQYDLKF